MMGLHAEINQLKKIENNENGVITIFLNTSPNERGKWKTNLKNGFKKIESELYETEEGKKKISQFQELKEKIEKEINNNEHKLLRSIVVYAEGGNGIFEVHFLQLDVNNEFVYANKPKIDQLETLNQTFPQTGIIVVQLDAISVYDTKLGEIEDVVYYELDLNTSDWRTYQGRGARGSAASSSQIDKYDSRKEKQIRRFYRGFSNDLNQMYKRYGWTELVVIGHQRSIKLLADELSLDVTRNINKNLGNSSEEEILRVAFEQ